MAPPGVTAADWVIVLAWGSLIGYVIAGTI